MKDRRMSYSRREFVGGLSLAGTAGVLGLGADSLAAEPPTETTRLRLLRGRSLCWAPQYVAEDLLKAEGFTDVIYVDFPGGGAVSELLAAAKADLSLHFVAPNIIGLDRGTP